MEKSSRFENEVDELEEHLNKAIGIDPAVALAGSNLELEILTNY